MDKEKISWRIINGFAWGKKILNVGEEVPRLISLSKKEGLFKQGKMAKVFESGKVLRYKPPFTARQDDLNLFLANPPLMLQYLERFDFDKKTLDEIITQSEKYGMDASYLKILRQALKEKIDG